MGCWAIDSFGNDIAADWLHTFLSQDSFIPVEQAIARVLRTGGDLSADDASEGLVALEVLAAALGRPTPAAEHEQDLMAWLEQDRPLPPLTLVEQGLNAIERILSHSSELRELWEETDEFDDWQAEVLGLRTRLEG